MIKSVRLINDLLKKIKKNIEEINIIDEKSSIIENELYTLYNSKKEIMLSKINKLKDINNTLENIFDNAFLYKGKSFFETFTNNTSVLNNNKMFIDTDKGILTYGIKEKNKLEYKTIYMSKNKKEIYIMFEDFISINCIDYEAYSSDLKPIYIEDIVLYEETQPRSFYESYMAFFEQNAKSFSSSINFNKTKVNLIKLIFNEPVSNYKITPFLTSYEDDCNIIYKIPNDNNSNNFTMNKHSKETNNLFKYEFSFNNESYKVIDFIDDTFTYLDDLDKNDFLYIKISSDNSKLVEIESIERESIESIDSIYVNNTKAILSHKPIEGSISISIGDYDFLNSIIKDPTFIIKDSSGAYLFDPNTIKIYNTISNADKIMFNNFSSFTRLKEGVTFIYSESENALYMPAVLKEFDLSIKYNYNEEIEVKSSDTPILFDFTIKMI